MSWKDKSNPLNLRMQNLQKPRAVSRLGKIYIVISTRVSKEIFWISTSLRVGYKNYRETYSRLKTAWLEQQQKTKDEQKEIQESKLFKNKLKSFNKKD